MTTPGTDLGNFAVPAPVKMNIPDFRVAAKTVPVCEKSKGSPTQSLPAKLPEQCPVTEQARFGGLVTSSPSLRNVFTLLERVAPTNVTITLTGETGTGKSLLAKAIHTRSKRARGPFVVFDCGAVHVDPIENTTYGREGGARSATPALFIKAFEKAHGGTLFLDNISDLPLEVQPRLLCALDHGVTKQLGSAQDQIFDVRIIAAANRDLAAQVACHRFRTDLYYRLGAAIVRIPALRERLEDLPELVAALLPALGRPDVVVDPGALEVLRQHHWPGNVRELKNVLSCALPFVEDGVLCPLHIRHLAVRQEDPLFDRLPLAGYPLAALEKAAIRQTLELTAGNKVLAAQRLGIAVSTLYEKLKRM